MSKRVVLSLVLVLMWVSSAAAQATVFIVRHAERVVTKPPGTPYTMIIDPDLSDAGRARAESLATLLKDAQITAIFATQYKRTQQTAAPMAKAAGLQVTIVHSDDVAGLIEKLKATAGNALVVGHSGSVPKVVVALGVQTPVTLAETDYDNLFIVTRDATPRMLRLHYR
ncbi:MAG: histidine phosphatase family protein [Acidobacteria bacterium]|nr:histidine phosphatase family protein [Acidobacteriota bacterium]